MHSIIPFEDVIIRTELQPGDIGAIVQMHGRLYKKECGYGLQFEAYVAGGLQEFCSKLGSTHTRGWLCERNGQFVGFIALLDRGEEAQLRYFILDPTVRGIGLGRKLMSLFMEHLKAGGFQKAFLLTTKELPAAAHLYMSNGFILKEEKEAIFPFGKPVVEQRYELLLK